MFGGLGFLVAGNMAVAASGQGGVLVWVDPSSSEALLKRTKAQPLEMRGREMPVGCGSTASTSVPSDSCFRGSSGASAMPALSRPSVDSPPRIVRRSWEGGALPERLLISSNRPGTPGPGQGPGPTEGGYRLTHRGPLL